MDGKPVRHALPLGDDLPPFFGALANPYRLRIVAALVAERKYISELAREIGMSRPLLHMHLRRLQAAGLVSSKLELSTDGRAMNYLTLEPFAIEITPEAIAEAARTLTVRDAGDEEAD